MGVGSRQERIRTKHKSEVLYRSRAWLKHALLFPCFLSVAGGRNNGERASMVVARMQFKLKSSRRPVTSSETQERV